MAKKKHSPEWMLAKVNEYLSGKGSYESIATANGIGTETLHRWVAKYLSLGPYVFQETKGNKRYTKEFKLMCVEAYIKGEGSSEELAARYNISCGYVLLEWVKKYNANMELKDYDPKWEVYMAEARRKTSIEERIEIAKYCIEHDLDYKGTAVTFDVSYSQVYSWVRKYNELGKDGLVDRRGHHKTDEEVDELERMRRENLRLKRQLEEKEMTIELLKKVKEFEGM